MEHVDLLISARWILPIAPHNTILEDHAIALSGDKIVAILPLEDAQERFHAEDYLELKSHAIMPGLVNAHAHTPMNLFRGLADDLDLMDWLNNHIWPAEKALINETSVAVGSQLAIAEMLRGGVTCFNDNYFFPHITAKVAIESGIRACLGNVIMSVPTEWASEETGYFERAEHILDNRPDSELITWSIAPHAPYTVSDESLKRAKALADAHDLPIHMHVHETAFEVEESIKAYGKRPIQRIDDLGLLSPQFIHVHATQLIEEEIARIRDTGSHVVHCPESNLKLASGFAPISELMAAGVNVAIGTDGAASNNDLDLFGELKTAALLAKAVSGNPKSLPAEEALKMATLNGAKAIGLGDKLGSLEPGKYADIIAIDLDSYLTQPVYNPISHLAYAINRLQVSHVWVAGKMLLNNGDFTQLEVTQLTEQAEYWSDKASSFKAGITQQKKATS